MLSIVELVKLAKQQEGTERLSILKSAYNISAGHTLRSVKAHLPQILPPNEDAALSLFKLLCPERAKNTKCTCGKELHFNGSKRGLGTYCSTKCAGSSLKVKQNRLNTVKSRYGVGHVMQNAEIKAATQQTNLERYGNICSAQGIEQAEVRLKALREKANETVRKAGETVFKRFGVTSAVHLPQIKLARRKAENIKWHNVTVKLKIQQLLIDCQVTCVQLPKEKFDDGIWEHSCGHQYSSNVFNASRCPMCHSSARSIPEREMLDFVRSLLPNEHVISGDRKYIAPFELDVLVPCKKVAFELNGVYWHRDTDQENLGLLKKTNLCNQHGIKLLHFWDYEWIYKRSIVKSMIKNSLNLIENKANARDMIIDYDVNTSEATEFCNNNHISGYTPANQKIGLRYHGELMCLMTVGKPRFDKNHELEIIRFCTKLNFVVRGGFSKLLKALNCKSIVSYADLRFYTGAAYKAADFTLLKHSPPNYCWAKGELILPRYKTQKHKLKNLLQNFDPLLTEYENMSRAGWIKHSDCGSLIFAINMS